MCERHHMAGSKLAMRWQGLGYAARRHPANECPPSSRPQRHRASVRLVDISVQVDRATEHEAYGTAD
jgi:hypothetical protein